MRVIMFKQVFKTGSVSVKIKENEELVKYLDSVFNSEAQTKLVGT